MIKNFIRVVLFMTFFLNSAWAFDDMKSNDIKITFNKKYFVASAPYWESDDFFSTSSNANFDLSNAANFDKWMSSPVLVKKFWGFKKPFVPGGLGVLEMRIRVLTSISSITELTPEKLIEVIEIRSLRLTEEINRELRDKHKDEKKYSPPTAFIQKVFNEREWVQYKFDANYEGQVYVTWLDNMHYIEIVFKYTDNGRGYKSDAKETASKNIISIMNSAKLLDVVKQ
ncbi:MAG: hypothetical protein K2P84_14795 [Undibacterium sp.]|nr:hypothetical protein [Undibacterium sp.]